MLYPRLAVGCIIEHGGLNVIHCVCKLCFGCFTAFKFKPQIHHLFALIFRKKSENSFCGFHFTLCLSFLSFLIIGICIACVNLDNIVNQEHCHCFKHINFRICIFGKHNGHYRHMPCVLGIVFLFSSVGKVGLTDDEFFLINFLYKIKLLFNS